MADCVALFSLAQAEAIPVDVHVWNIACRDYDASLQHVKSLTPSVYRQVGDIYRSRFVTKAGWAHSLLFVAELPSFRPILPADMIEEMDKVRSVKWNLLHNGIHQVAHHVKSQNTLMYRLFQLMDGMERLYSFDWKRRHEKRTPRKKNDIHVMANQY